VALREQAHELPVLEHREVPDARRAHALVGRRERLITTDRLGCQRHEIADWETRLPSGALGSHGPRRSKDAARRGTLRGDPRSARLSTTRTTALRSGRSSDTGRSGWQTAP